MVSMIVWIIVGALIIGTLIVLAVRMRKEHRIMVDHKPIVRVDLVPKRVIAPVQHPELDTTMSIDEEFPEYDEWYEDFDARFRQANIESQVIDKITSSIKK